MKINKRAPRHWLLLLRQGLYTLLAICWRYLSRRRGKPVVILYGHQLSGNLKALYEEWRQARAKDFDCYFLSLDPVYGPELRAEGVNVLQCSSLGDMLLVGRCSAMITDHGLHAMSPLLRCTDIIFVDVWHGIPFKGFIPDDFRVQHRYDEVWVSSPLLRDIYVDKFGFPADIVRPLGYARADKLFRGDNPSGEFRKQFSVPNNQKIVLYAPTWQQDDNGHELFPFGVTQDNFIQPLSEICRANSATLVIRSHLNAQINAKLIENVIYCSMKDYADTEDLLQETDLLICDWSSIAFDYLALRRPAIFLDVEPPYKNGLSLGREYRFGEVVNDLLSLKESLAEILQEPDDYNLRHEKTRAKITSQVYGAHTHGIAGKMQLMHLVQLIHGRNQ